MDATEPESTPQPHTIDTTNTMTQVIATAATPVVTSPNGTSTIMPAKADVSTDSIAVKISDTLGALSLSGSDETTNGHASVRTETVVLPNEASDSAAEKASVRKPALVYVGIFHLTRLQTAEPEAAAKAAESTAQADALVPEAAAKPVPEPFAQQLQQMAVDPVDQPDPRLIDALGNQRDRIFVIKLEKEFVGFVKNERYMTSSLAFFVRSPC
jgi:hypothetical protein